MMGDGGGIGDSCNFSQNKKSFLGKIMRVDVDSTTNKLPLSSIYAIINDLATKKLPQQMCLEKKILKEQSESSKSQLFIKQKSTISFCQLSQLT